MSQIATRVFSVLVSCAVLLADWSCALVLRALGKRPPPVCVVLLYHSIRSRDLERFKEQMDILLRHSMPIQGDFTTKLCSGARYAVVTFDDGLKNTVENALPVLQEKNIPAVVFVVVEALGKLPSWGQFSRGANEEDRLMNVEQLLGLSSKLVIVGSHTLTHPVLTELSESLARTEIAESRLRLRKILGQEVKLFSFPYGRYSADLVRCCEEAGYTRVFTILPRLAAGAGEYVTGRVCVEPTDWKLEFQLKLMGAYRWQSAAFAAKKALVRSFAVLFRLNDLVGDPSCESKTTRLPT